MNNARWITPDEAIEMSPGPKDQAMTDLKIEAGKCYETRGGRKGFPCYQNKHGDWHGLVQMVAGKRPRQVTWSKGGRIIEGEECSSDLISEWKEPRKGEVWVSIPEFGAPYISSWSNSDGSCGAGYVDPTPRSLDAHVCIPWTEGQGLDGEGSE